MDLEVVTTDPDSSPAGPSRLTGPTTSLFRSFWMGGFESAYHISRRRQRLDMVAATQHDRFINEDYARLRSFGIRCARESARWHLIDRGGGHYDFSSLIPFLDAAQKQGIQILWTLCHYGWPEDLNLLSPAFIERFAAYCGAVARLIADRTDQPRWYTPVNEISYFAWASGSVGYFYPFAKRLGGRVKQQLVRAWIAACEAIWAVDKEARMLCCDPLINVVPSCDSDTARCRALAYNRCQHDARDMVRGALEPQLGGQPRYLDVVGVNFYCSNQWNHRGGKLHWVDRPLDPRWVPLHQLLLNTYRHYQRPLLISETSHCGTGRGIWLEEITRELILAHQRGVPIEGICLYPIIDRPDWDDPGKWHNSGLWDLQPDGDGRLLRVLDTSYASALRRCQMLWEKATAPPTPRPVAIPDIS